MMNKIPLLPDISLWAMQTQKFKTGCFSVNFLRQHCRQTAALDALLPNVLLRGTEQYPDIAAISTRMDELYGASFGSLARLKGEVKMTGFYADYIEDDFLPDGDTVFAPLLDFLHQVLYHPFTENGCFPSKSVEGEKQNLINAIESSLNDKRTYANERLRRIMCENEAYGVPRLGFVEDVEKITPELLWAHYREVLASSAVRVFYAGRLQPEDAARHFRTVFDGSVRKPCVPVSTQVIPAAEKVREVSESMEVTQGKLAIGLRTGITAADADYPALMLLNAVYGAGITSKLFVNVREKLSLCYYASSALEKNKGIMIVSSGIEFDQYETAKKAILNELDACKKGDITDEELLSAREQIISALRAAMDAPARLDDYYMGCPDGHAPDMETLIALVQSLTKQDVVRAANRITTDTVFFLKGADA